MNYMNVFIIEEKKGNVYNYLGGFKDVILIFNCIIVVVCFWMFFLLFVVCYVGVVW